MSKQRQSNPLRNVGYKPNKSPVTPPLTFITKTLLLPVGGAKSTPGGVNKILWGSSGQEKESNKSHTGSYRAGPTLSTGLA